MSDITLKTLTSPNVINNLGLDAITQLEKQEPITYEDEEDGGTVSIPFHEVSALIVESREVTPVTPSDDNCGGLTLCDPTEVAAFPSYMEATIDWTTETVYTRYGDNNSIYVEFLTNDELRSDISSVYSEDTSVATAEIGSFQSRPNVTINKVADGTTNIIVTFEGLDCAVKLMLDTNPA